MFSIFRKKPKCKHSWILNDIHVQYINSYIEVSGDDRFVLYCTECKREKTVREHELMQMESYGLVNK
ncbi:hypothetical protein EEL30_21765 [Brevibacillus laterosporus]|uniref:Uncharacterized protein n=1 Tax=Brevibacillus laterosporus TaxID=1465 RepID=A0A518VCE8_BRELA|nr:hypothetical protein EEL30_21765 [Brevibacillus laterosporus]